VAWFDGDKWFSFCARAIIGSSWMLASNVVRVLINRLVNPKRVVGFHLAAKP
jgi:hypothetical protein